jgi:hypothetical protein
VNAPDLLLVFAAWDGPGGVCDLTDDGQVDLDDLQIVYERWGPCPQRGWMIELEGKNNAR